MANLLFDIVGVYVCITVELLAKTKLLRIYRPQLETSVGYNFVHSIEMVEKHCFKLTFGKKIAF